jgi:type II secretory pathway component GspD/PulD (secretin)/tetratricopeptide (TPR) repeat protein
MFSTFRFLVGVTAAWLALCPPAFAQSSGSAIDEATKESIRRQAAKVDVRAKIAKAQEAEKAGKFAEAYRLYEDCLLQLKTVNNGVEAEYAEVKSGMGLSRLQVAQQAQRGGDLLEAEKQVDRVLIVDPDNKAAQEFRRNLDKVKAQVAGKMPSPEALALLPEINAQQAKQGTKLQDAKVLIEAGRLKEAEAKLNEILAADANNQGAYYYLNVIREQRHSGEILKREGWFRDQFAEVTREWMDPNTRNALPQPNGYARTNMVHTSRARQMIFSKLSRITLNEMKFESKNLSEVIKDLFNESQKRDPDRTGVNMLLAPNIDLPVAVPQLDANGTPIPTPAADSAPLLSDVIINVPTPLRGITLAEMLDAIIKVADRPIKYSVEDYAIVFSFRSREPEQLFTRTFKVDPNSFRQGLESVTAASFGSEGGQGGSGGGGGGGGGSRGGGGGSRGGGGGGGQGGQQQAQEQFGASFAGINIAPTGAGGGAGGGGAGAAGIPSDPQTYRGELGSSGVTFLTRPAYTQVIGETVRNFFTAAGVTLLPPKQLFYNDRNGLLMVRATLADLDIIEQAVQILSVPPPQLSIKARFAEVNLSQNKALGFDWMLGNTLVGDGKMGLQGGTAPTYSGTPTAANPIGSFPFPGFGSGVSPSANDGLLTSGLRQDTTPTLGTFTGILTDPQFRVAIKALEQRGGINVLNAPEVVTVSSRQTQIKAVDVKFVVTDIDLNQTGSGGGGGGTGGVNVNSGGQGGVASAIQPIATPTELGPILDVIPYVSADGYTIQMTIIPTLKEFVGYDFETAQQFQVRATSVGTTAVPTLSQPIPLPQFRLRQVATTAVVWDGQTVVLGGLISESETKTKDKVPFLGDLPLFGRLFRSESNISDKKNLMIFVTPTIIDPAGNRVHSEEEMPFAKNGIPSQTPTAVAQSGSSVK